MLRLTLLGLLLLHSALCVDYLQELYYSSGNCDDNARLIRMDATQISCNDQPTEPCQDKLGVRYKKVCGTLPLDTTVGMLNNTYDVGQADCQNRIISRQFLAVDVCFNGQKVSCDKDIVQVLYANPDCSGNTQTITYPDGGSDSKSYRRVGTDK